MASSGNQDPAESDGGWLAIGRILLIQVVVLLAPAVAVIFYLDWSSATNMTEFIAASRTAAQASDPGSSSVPPVQAAKSQQPCRRGD